ncbi:MAG: DegT/DnrJ/EryC1/StrS aminotransferase family protein [Spirochaetaceae bacterium]|jgi:dTDP-4-amino-4,6-dideoxygalactose transaminase|nr:DegT/DnrJ/EryC1/StrS aminotransferase family protein [Spirochaetaceae bacterium]
MTKKPLPFARPFIGEEEEKAVLDVLRSGWITTGKEALLFEKEFADFLAPAGGLCALAVNSATSGLHLALEALGVGPGDVVFVPSLTFASTAEAALYLGAEVVFVDVEPNSFNMSPKKLRLAVERCKKGLAPNGAAGPFGTPKAALPVHYGGFPCDMAAINEVARDYGLFVVEDCAHCFPSFTNGVAAGDFGDAGVFSFYATKTITTGEGGMIVSRNENLIKRASIMRLHGIDRPAWNRYSDVKSSWNYEILDAGFKYNLPDVLAAIGRAQLKRAFDLLEKRCSIAERYDRAFANERGLRAPSSCKANAWHLYPLRIKTLDNDRKKIFEKRMVLASFLQKEGIGVSVHFIPLHTMPLYKKRYNILEDALPNSMDVYSGEISLPIWPGMTEYDVERVVDSVKSGLREIGL